MFKAGLIDFPNQKLIFAFPLAKRYVFWKLFSYRADRNPDTLFDLVKLSIQMMSSSLLCTSTVTSELPKEGIFQHQFMNALAKNTDLNTYICPELSQLFPLDADEETEISKINGEIDFFVDETLRWGIELLVHGRDITKHINSFSEGGKYAQLHCNDYVVVDFRLGKPSNRIKLHSNRITVFFTSNAFRSCIIMYGQDGTREQLELLN